MQVPEHLRNYIDYEAYGRDVAMDESGDFTDLGYVRDTGSSFHEYYDGEPGSIPEEYRVMAFQDDIPEEELSEWAMDIAYDMDEFFRQRDPQYAAEHPEEHAAKEEIYENLMAGRISALGEKLADLGQTQDDYLPSELEKFKEASGYEEVLDVSPEPTPDDRETGETVRTPRGTFYVTDMSREQMEAAGYGFHHQSEDGNYLIMGNGSRAFAIRNGEAQEHAAPEKMTVLVVEPRKEPYVKEIDPGLHSLQAEVGGDNAGLTEGFLAHQLPDLTGAAVMPVAVIILIFLFDWRLGICCLIPMGISVIFLKQMMGGDNAQFMGKYMTALETMNKEAVEYIRGIPVVKVFQQTIYSFKNFHAAIEEYEKFASGYALKCRIPLTGFTVTLNGTFVLLIPVAMLILSGVSGQAAYENVVLDFLFYSLFTPVCATMMNRIMFASEQLMAAKSAVSRVDKILQEQPLKEPEQPLIPADASIVFSDVSFAYPGAKEKALDHISFEVPTGKTVALVGASGSGKSTAASLIPRFYDVQSGSVTIGGVDVRNIEKQELMKRVAFVFQNIWICGTRRKTGNTHCQNKDIPEQMLKEACAAVLGLDTFDEIIFSEQIDRIEIPAPNEMIFYFKDGHIVPHRWESTMRKNCWTDERRAAKGRYVQEHQLGPNSSCFTSRIRCDSCGENYRRQRSRHKDGSFDSVWRCASGGKCNSPSIKEEVLKNLCADAMGLESFDETAFREQIACIHIVAPFQLSIRFFDGHTFEAAWENKRKMPKHTEQRKQHMREVMIQKWREKRGESNDDTGDDQPVHGNADQ